MFRWLIDFFKEKLKTEYSELALKDIELMLEDFENPNGEFDLSEAPDFLRGEELQRFYRKYKVKVILTSPVQLVGDDGICRSWPGSSFYYD